MMDEAARYRPDHGRLYLRHYPRCHYLHVLPALLRGGHRNLRCEGLSKRPLRKKDPMRINPDSPILLALSHAFDAAVVTVLGILCALPVVTLDRR